MDIKLLEDSVLIRNEKKTIKTELLKVEKNIFGEEVFTYIGSNDLLLGGRLFILQKFGNLNTDIKPPTLNHELQVEDNYVEPLQGLELNDIVCLMGLGLDGADKQIASTMEVDIKSKGFNNLENMVPFRIVRKGSAEETQCDKLYHMKKEKDGEYYYYLKPPKIDPLIQCMFEDGTPVTSNTWSSEKNIPIHTYVDFHFLIDGNDLREYFQKMNNMRACRYNSICLYAGVKTTLPSGRVEYKNVRAITKYNTENEALDKTGKTLNLIYRVYIS